MRVDIDETACCIRLPGKERATGIKGPSHLGVRSQLYADSTVTKLAFHRRVTRSHGNSGVVKSKFRANLPPHAFGASVRVVRKFNFVVLLLLLTKPADDVPLHHLIGSPAVVSPCTIVALSYAKYDTLVWPTCSHDNQNILYKTRVHSRGY